jgi:tRNA-specific 2-thiouridylase
VVIGKQEELACRNFSAHAANWLLEPPAARFACSVKLRYRSLPVPATVELGPEDCFRVELAHPRHGISPGQAAVCYDGDRVLGGGWID